MKEMSKSCVVGLFLLIGLGVSPLQAQLMPRVSLLKVPRLGNLSPEAGLADAGVRIPVVPFTFPGGAAIEIVPPTRPNVAILRPQCPFCLQQAAETFASITASVEAAVPARRITEPASSKGIFFPGKKDIDAVIFDMDGTLLDSLPVWEHSASNFVRSQGIEPEPTLDDEMSKLSLTDGARIIKQRYGFDLSEEEILRLTLAPIRQHYLEDIQAKPGVPLLLRRLKAQGIKVSVATASDKELAEKVFARLGLTPYIDFIITCDEVGVGKRRSVVFDAALARLGTEKERTLVVEDALYALETARDAGYLTAGVEEPFHPAAHAQAIKTAGNYFIHSFVGPGVVRNF